MMINRCQMALATAALLLAVVSFDLTSSQVIEINRTDCSQWAFWASWSQVSLCTVPCGTGTQTRQRQRACLARDVRQVDRQTFECNVGSVHGGFGQWGRWSTQTRCPTFCGRGLRKRTRKRKCANTTPSCGGRECNEEDLVEESFRTCYRLPCFGFCSHTSQPTYISPFRPAPGYYLECRSGSGYMKRCPRDIFSSMIPEFEDVAKVCQAIYF
ncbi:thrombospondin-1-like [Aplysia californica]|uniref:Thrombospondin-1-like n=1 Tax=Aplysia californica TaxID=6500 RepID=A0ABM0K2H3_APLCA|nr:thrombospondin-1-like [Aplysia californica]